MNEALFKYIEMKQKEIHWKLRNVPYPDPYYKGYDMGILQEYEMIKEAIKNNDAEYFINLIDNP